MVHCVYLLVPPQLHFITFPQNVSHYNTETQYLQHTHVALNMWKRFENELCGFFVTSNLARFGSIRRN